MHYECLQVESSRVSDLQPRNCEDQMLQFLSEVCWDHPVQPTDYRGDQEHSPPLIAFPIDMKELGREDSYVPWRTVCNRSADEQGANAAGHGCHQRSSRTSASWEPVVQQRAAPNPAEEAEDPPLRIVSCCSSQAY